MKARSYDYYRIYHILFIVFSVSMSLIYCENKQKSESFQQSPSKKLNQRSLIKELQRSLQTQQINANISTQQNSLQILYNPQLKKPLEKQQNQTRIKQQYKRIKTSQQYYDKLLNEIKQIPKAQVINATHLANGKQVCLNGKICQFYYYVIPPQLAGSSQGKQRPIKNILIVSGMHGNQYIGPLSVLYSVRHLKASQTRIILFPLSNPSGFDLNRRLVNPTGVDPNRDFPIQQYTRCYQSSSTSIIDSIFREFQVDLTLALHNGKSQIGWNWGTVRQKRQSHTQDQTIYRDIGEWMKYLGGYNSKINMDQFKVGTMNQVIYPVTGGFEDWAYAASWYENNKNQVTFTSTPSCSFQPYPLNMTNGLVFLFQLGPFIVDQTLFGTQEGILMNPKTKNISNGYISRTVRMFNHLVKVINPHLNIKFTNTQMIFTVEGCKKCQIPVLKVRESQTNITVCILSEKLQIQGNINNFSVEPSIIKLERKIEVQDKGSQMVNASYSSKTLSIEYTLKCDPDWQGIGNTIFSKPRTFQIKQSLTLWNHKFPSSGQNYFNSLKQALQSFKFKQDDQKQSDVIQFIAESKDNLFIGVVVIILLVAILYIVFKVCKSVGKDLEKRKLQLIKSQIYKVNIDSSLSDDSIQKTQQGIAIKKHPIQKVKKGDSYPQLCQSDKSMKNQQLHFQKCIEI